MEKPSFHNLSAPREEFPEPPPSTRIILTSGSELFPGLITLVRKPPFSGLESENPYYHLSDFEHLCSLFAIAGMTQDTLKWKLFPFSLIGKAEQWYTYTVGSVHDNWDELRDKFCLEFFLMSRIIALHRDIRSFQQNERESIRAAWYRFLSLIESGPVLSIPESLLLRNFYEGLDKYSAFHLDVVSGGSFSRMTLAEGRKFLYDIIDSIVFTIMPNSSGKYAS